jgi:hypothetical protein
LRPELQVGDARHPARRGGDAPAGAVLGIELVAEHLDGDVGVSPIRLSLMRSPRKVTTSVCRPG